MQEKKNVLNRIKALQSNMPLQKGRNPESIKKIKRIKSFLNVLYNNIDSMDENLINSNYLVHEHEIYNHFDNIAGYLNEFKTHNNLAELDYINNSINEIITVFHKLYLFPYDFNKAVVENSKSLHVSFESLFDYVKQEEISLNQKIQEANEKADILRQMLEDHAGNIDNIITDTNTRFNKAYDNQNKRFNEAYEKYMKTADISQQKMNIQIEEYRQKIINKHNEILKLAGVVAGDTYSAEYNKNADNERKNANLWRLITLAIVTFSIAGLGWFAYELLQNIPQDISSPMIFYKFSISFPVLFLAYYLINYSSKQSKYHREKESYYRDFALKVKSIDPYISELEPDLQQLLKTYVASELFTNTDNTTLPKTEQKAGLIKEIFNKIISLIKKDNGGA